jgi:3-(3-hydroxy-phenyl)propionate hydroxylase
VRALLGAEVEFTLEWASVYTFACMRMDAFRHGRVLFAGDAAHGVSPFGARGANSGVQDADNLAWKLAYVLQGRAGDALLESYGPEREAAADENIRHSTRATDFITPKSEISRVFRDATLALAKDFPFARALVNSGRLSQPATLAGSPLNTADADPFAGGLRPGAPAADGPVRTEGRGSWLLRETASGAFTALLFAGADAAGVEEDVRRLVSAARCFVPLSVLVIGGDRGAKRGQAEARPLQPARVLEDVGQLLVARYDATAGTLYLLRPDQHVCARWREVPDEAGFAAALRRALAQTSQGSPPP